MVWIHWHMKYYGSLLKTIYMLNIYAPKYIFFRHFIVSIFDKQKGAIIIGKIKYFHFEKSIMN
jgi:hypothetical protein